MAPIYAITGIGMNAFSNQALVSVSIPNSVTTIGAFAFKDNLLTSIVLPTALTTIDDDVFMHNLLTSVEIPEGVTDIVQNAFRGNRLTSVTLPSGLTRIGNGAFYYNRLTAVTIPAGVTEIQNWAFDGSPDLASVLMLGPVPPIVLSYAFGAVPFTVVSYLEQYGAPGVTGGYTSPVWRPSGSENAYNAEAISSVSSLSLAVNAPLGSPIAGAPATATGSRLLGNSAWSVRLDPGAVPVTTGTTSSSGGLSESFVLPGTIPAGHHILTLTAVALDQSTITSVVYVTVRGDGTLGYLSTDGPETLAATGVSDFSAAAAAGGGLFLAGLVLLVAVRRRRAANRLRSRY